MACPLAIIAVGAKKNLLIKHRLATSKWVSGAHMDDLARR